MKKAPGEVALLRPVLKTYIVTPGIPRLRGATFGILIDFGSQVRAFT